MTPTQVGEASQPVCRMLRSLPCVEGLNGHITPTSQLPGVGALVGAPVGASVEAVGEDVVVGAVVASGSVGPVVGAAVGAGVGGVHTTRPGNALTTDMGVLTIHSPHSPLGAWGARQVTSALSRPPTTHNISSSTADVWCWRGAGKSGSLLHSAPPA